MTVSTEKVDRKDRMLILYRHFGEKGAQFSNVLHDTLTAMCVTDHPPGAWDLVELSNGSFYMVPDAKAELVYVRNPDNRQEAELNPEAAGIATTLVAFGKAWFLEGDDARMVTRCNGLLELVRERPDKDTILRIADHQ